MIKENMPKLENNSPYSYGTFAAMHSLDELIRTPEAIGGSSGKRVLPFSVDTVLININTLIRNLVNDTSKKVSDYKSAVHEEFVNIIDEIKLSFESLELPPPAPLIVFYSMDHRSHIPAEYLRPLNQATTATDTVIKRISKSITNKDQMYGQLKIKLFASFNTPPLRTLKNFVIDSRNSRRVVMISHEPIDYHVSPSCQSFRIIQSHNGFVLWPKEFSKKVFKLETVPYIEEIHTLIGDTVSLLPSINRTDKSLLKDISVKENWGMRTRDYVLDSLRKNNFKQAYTFK